MHNRFQFNLFQFTLFDIHNLNYHTTWLIYNSILINHGRIMGCFEYLFFILHKRYYNRRKNYTCDIVPIYELFTHSWLTLLVVMSGGFVVDGII